MASAAPYGQWLKENMISIGDLPKPASVIPPDRETVLRRQETFGYTTEDLKVLVAPMANDGVEATGSMGTDTPLAVLSSRPQLLYNYFKQLFAQVTNPPVDAIREEIIMAVDTSIGPEGNLLEPTPASARQIKLPTPVLRNEELEKLRNLNGQDGSHGFKSVTLPTCSVAGQSVDTGSEARCFAQYMRIHTLEATQGVPYALMGRYVAAPAAPKSQLTPDGATNNEKYAVTDPKTKQPVENGARNIWVTETALTTALNSSYMATQMATFGIVVGIALLLSGFGFLILAIGGALENDWAFRRARKAETKTAAPLGA